MTTDQKLLALSLSLSLSLFYRLKIKMGPYSSSVKETQLFS